MEAKSAIMEEWKVIPRYPKYEISTLGRIRKAKPSKTWNRVGRLLNPFLNGSYLAVNFICEGKHKKEYIHRLVAEAFLGPCPKDKEVDHKDGNKANCSLSNLRYVTPKVNINNPNRRIPHGENHFRSKLSLNEVITILGLYRDGISQKELATLYGVNSGTISCIVRRKSWARALNGGNNGGI